MVDSNGFEEERNTNLTLSNDSSCFKLFGKRIVTAADQTLSTTSDTSPETERNPFDSSERLSVATEPAVPVEVVTVAIGLVCPRCKSRETKFCYFNNYNVNQPRHFCRGCHRYWTAGGAIRNVPIGAGRRKAVGSNTGAGGGNSSCSNGSGAKSGGGFGYSHDHDEVGMEQYWLRQAAAPPPESNESVVGFLPVKRGNDIGGFHGRIRRPKV